MYDIRYENGLLISNIGEICNLRRPFSKMVDHKRRKSSLDSLKISPEMTYNTSQIRRFMVEFNSKLYRMHVVREGESKSQVIYQTETSIPKVLKSKYLKSLIENLDVPRFENIKRDLNTSIKLVYNSWEFDGIVTDTPLGFDYTNTYHVGSNNLITYKGLDLGIISLISTYNKLPLSILGSNTFSEIDKESTDLPKIPLKCPLIICRSNYAYASFLSRIYGGLPVIIFR